MRRIWLPLLVIICTFLLLAPQAHSSNSAGALVNDITKIEKDTVILCGGEYKGCYEH